LANRGAGSGTNGDPERGLEPPPHRASKDLPSAAHGAGERARTHEAQARLAAIVDSSDDAIISKSLDGRILTWNAGAEQLFGYSADEAIGQSILMIIPPERAGEEEMIVSRLRAGERIGHFETERLTKGGRRVDVSLTISPVHDRSGRVIGASKVARDITLEKRAREVLRENGRVKDEFLAILAHELRNRLAPICTALKTLVNHGQIAPESKPALDIIDRQTTQMVRLVEDLLDISRIARNELPLRKKRVKLQDVLREAFEVSRPLIDEREHAITVSEPPRPIYLEADRVRLAQAVTNLLNNAARYTDRGGRMSLTAERQGDEAVITVRDNGPGVAPEMLPRLFEMFVQMNSSPESQRGLGVGLTLVKRIVELHGGTIEGRSEGLGKGSEFVVRIPVAKGPRRRARPSEEATVAGNGARRVLVVDDDRDLATSLAMALTSMGNEVRTANDGAVALEIASEWRPHAVALDVSLPIMSGFDVVRQLRQQTWGEKIITIALTGWTQDEIRQRAIDAGFDHYVVKPVEAALLTKLFGASDPAH